MSEHTSYLIDESNEKYMRQLQALRLTDSNITRCLASVSMARLYSHNPHHVPPFRKHTIAGPVYLVELSNAPHHYSYSVIIMDTSKGTSISKPISKSSLVEGKLDKFFYLMTHDNLIALYIPDVAELHRFLFMCQHVISALSSSPKSIVDQCFKSTCTNPHIVRRSHHCVQSLQQSIHALNMVLLSAPRSTDTSTIEQAIDALHKAIPHVKTIQPHDWVHTVDVYGERVLTETMATQAEVLEKTKYITSTFTAKPKVVETGVKTLKKKVKQSPAPKQPLQQKQHPQHQPRTVSPSHATSQAFSPLVAKPVGKPSAPMVTAQVISPTVIQPMISSSPTSSLEVLASSPPEQSQQPQQQPQPPQQQQPPPQQPPSLPSPQGDLASLISTLDFGNDLSLASTPSTPSTHQPSYQSQLPHTPSSSSPYSYMAPSSASLTTGFTLPGTSPVNKPTLSSTSNPQSDLSSTIASLSTAVSSPHTATTATMTTPTTTTAPTNTMYQSPVNSVSNISFLNNMNNMNNMNNLSNMNNMNSMIGSSDGLDPTSLTETDMPSFMALNHPPPSSYRTNLTSVLCEDPSYFSNIYHFIKEFREASDYETPEQTRCFDRFFDTEAVSKLSVQQQAELYYEALECTGSHNLTTMYEFIVGAHDASS